jgi:dTDP-4-dehydrorhamnose reductase
MSKKIMILGSSGLLGSSLVDFFVTNNINILCHARDGSSKFNADLSDAKETLDMLKGAEPDVLINLAGLTNVDYCEENPQAAYVSNVKILENLKAYLTPFKPTCHLIHISTDHVYDGIGDQRIDEINIKNFYAFSKYAGELAALSVGENVSVLRTNFFGLSLCSTRHSFTDWLYQSAIKKQHIQVYDDVLFSPLSMRTLIKYINLILNNTAVGLVNLGSRNGMSKANFAFEFIQSLQLNTSFMSRVNSSDAQLLKTPRPLDMRMDSTSFEKTFNLQLPTLKDEINLIAGDYYEKTK